VDITHRGSSEDTKEKSLKTVEITAFQRFVVFLWKSRNNQKNAFSGAQKWAA
jgi:hypothetical protein